MRNLVGIFGSACGLVVIGLVSRYGYKSTDVEADAWIMAFLFGVIAAGGLFGHAVAVRLWRRNRLVAIICGLICAVALVINLSNSLGAIAGRADESTTARIKANKQVRDDTAELVRLGKQRASAPEFVPTDEKAVEAGKRAADTATSARNAECGNGDPKQRGKNCREREADEKVATDRFVTIAANKAATDTTLKLESDMRELRERLAQAGPIVPVNVQGWAIARLFRLPDEEADFAVVAQQFGIAVIVELLIVMSLIAFELLRIENAEAGTAAIARRGSKAGTTLSVNESAAAQIKRFFLQAVRTASGERVAASTVVAAYQSWCADQGLKPQSATMFGRLAPWPKQRIGGRIWYLDATISEPYADRDPLPRVAAGGCRETQLSRFVGTYRPDPAGR
jgi:hypothetical protein